MKVKQNTFPEYFNVPHGKPGDECYWQIGKCCNLIRKSDDKIIYFSKTIDYNGLLYKGKPPTLIGILAEVRCEGWVLEIEE